MQMPKRKTTDPNARTRTQLSEMIQNSNGYLSVSFTLKVPDSEFVRRVCDLGDIAHGSKKYRSELKGTRVGDLVTIDAKFIKMTPMGYLLMEESKTGKMKNVDPRTLEMIFNGECYLRK